jgi:hypothetical protein
MNRALPRGDRGRGGPTSRWASRRAGTVPGAGGLVAGTAAAASGPRIGHRCATFGPRWLRQRWRGVSAEASCERTRARARSSTGGFQSNQAWRLRAFLARNTMRLGTIPRRGRGLMFLIDRRGMRPVCVACRSLGPYQEAVPGSHLCEGCVRAADAHLQELAESVPELRHRLRRWRKGCDCGRCRERGVRAV